MAKITRDNLYDTLKKVNDTIDENNKKKFQYITGDRYLTGWGIISEMTDKKELVEVYSFLKDQLKTTDEAAEELGISPEELEDEEETPTLCGYKIKDWMQDVKTRIEELRLEEKTEKLQKAKGLLENNLSEEERFDLQMSMVESLI
jgi:thiaminase